MSRLSEAVEQAALTGATPDGAGVLSRTFCFPPDFPGFDGHFPGYPILPAVVQILACQAVAETRLPPGFRLHRVQHAKFLKQIRPDERVLVSCRLHPEGEAWVAEARVEKGPDLAATLHLVFAPGKELP
jgi:3-hydroxyacyl-[acyl-carrier-protein] dehydratase